MISGLTVVSMGVRRPVVGGVAEPLGSNYLVRFRCRIEEGLTFLKLDRELNVVRRRYYPGFNNAALSLDLRWFASHTRTCEHEVTISRSPFDPDLLEIAESRLETIGVCCEFEVFQVDARGSVWFCTNINWTKIWRWAPGTTTLVGHDVASTSNSFAPLVVPQNDDSVTIYTAVHSWMRQSEATVSHQRLLPRTCQLEIVESADPVDLHPAEPTSLYPHDKKQWFALKLAFPGLHEWSVIPGNPRISISRDLRFLRFQIFDSDCLWVWSHRLELPQHSLRNLCLWSIARGSTPPWQQTSCSAACLEWMDEQCKNIARDYAASRLSAADCATQLSLMH
jgi:hypothetical protein